MCFVMLYVYFDDPPESSTFKQRQHFRIKGDMQSEYEIWNSFEVLKWEFLFERYILKLYLYLDAFVSHF